MDRTSQPPFQKSLTFTLPTPERIPLAGSQEIVYLPSNLGEAVKIEFVFEAGRYYETMPGLAQFTVQMLDKGVPGKDANQIASLLEYYGAHIELNAGFDFASLSLYALRKNIKKLLPVLITILSKPEFPERELTTLRKIFNENLKVSLEKNAFIASNAIRKNLFGSHPYGRSIQLGDADKIEVDDIKFFYDKHIHASKIFVVGTIDDADLDFLSKNIEPSPDSGNLVNQEFDSLPPATEKLDGPNKVQASLKLGRRTISRLHPDIAGLLLTNHLLGGFFGSRLMKNIREEKGLTYGISSSIQHHLKASILIISADVNSDNSDIALREIEKELESISSVNDSELEIVKNHLIGSIQNDITTVFAAGEKIKSSILYNLPENFYQKLILDISKIETPDLIPICSMYLNPKEFTTVVV